MTKKFYSLFLLGFLSLVMFQSRIKTAVSDKKPKAATQAATPKETFYFTTFFPGSNSDPKEQLNFCSNYWRPPKLNSGTFSEESLFKFFSDSTLDFRSPSEMRLLNTFYKILTGSKQDLIPFATIDGLIKRPSLLSPLVVDKSAINFPSVERSLEQVMKWVRESLSEIGKISANNQIRAGSDLFNQYVLVQAAFTSFNDIFTDKYDARIALVQQKISNLGDKSTYFKDFSKALENIFTSNTPGTIASSSQRQSLEEKIRTLSGYLEPSVNGYCACLESLLIYRKLFENYLLALISRLDQYCNYVSTLDADIIKADQIKSQSLAALQNSSTVTSLELWTRAFHARELVKSDADYQQCLVNRHHVVPVVLNNVANSVLCACRSMIVIEAYFEFFIAPLRNSSGLEASQEKYVQKFEAQEKKKGKIDSFITKLFKDDFANKISKRFKALVAAYDGDRSKFVSMFNNQLSRLQGLNYLKNQNNNLSKIVNRGMSLVDQLISPPTLGNTSLPTNSFSQQNRFSAPTNYYRQEPQSEVRYANQNSQPRWEQKPQPVNQKYQQSESESEEGSSVLDGETEIASQASEDLDEEFDHSEDGETQDNDTESNILSRQPSSLSSRSSMMADVDEKTHFKEILISNGFRVTDQDEVFKSFDKVGKLEELENKWIFVVERNLPSEIWNDLRYNLVAKTALHWLDPKDGIQMIAFKE